MIRAISLTVACLLIDLLLSRRPSIAQTAEIADRSALESVWKRSGRTTRVIDYPFSPQIGEYGGPELRDWGNRGYIFINPKIREIPPLPIEAGTPAPEGAQDLELARSLAEERAQRQKLEADLQALQQDLKEQGEKNEDQAVKILQLEQQLEEMERIGPGERPFEGAFATGTQVEAGVAEKTDIYMVRPGENLWGISAKPEVYSNPYKWLLLYHANRDQIFDPDLIYPGMFLLVPRYQGMDFARPAPTPEEKPAEGEKEAEAQTVESEKKPEVTPAAEPELKPEEKPGAAPAATARPAESGAEKTTAAEQE